MSVGPVVVIPVRDGVLPSGGLDAAAEALDADPDAQIVLIGSTTGTAAGDLAGVAEHIQTIEAGDYAVGAWAAGLADRCAAASFVLVPGSPDGRDLAARLAVTLGWPLLANALSVTADNVVVSHHGGRLQSNVVPDGPFVATLQPGVRGVAAHGDVIRLDAVEIDLGGSGPDATVLGIDPPEAATMDLAEAPRIVGGGAGLMGPGSAGGADAAERFARLTEVGAAIDASMGATRVVTDAGWVHHDRQIGTTGVVVDPDLYLAFGISGAVQHTAGLGNPDHVISVNTDPHCPMMAMADLAVVADANAVLDELAARLDLTSGPGPAS